MNYREIYTELVTFLNKKDKLLEEAGLYIEKIQNQTLDTTKLKNIVEKYQAQEKKNLEKLNKIKNEIKLELTQNSKNQKLLKAYGDGEERIYGNILDFRE
jgi:hypothetical protein